MDELDLRILAALKKDGRTTFVKIAKRHGVTEGAVRARVKKLIAAKVIRKFTIEVGESTRAVVMVGASHSVPTSRISDEIKNLGIGKVYEISGNYDIICFVDADNTSELNGIIERIRKINGVVDTATSMVLR